MQRSSLLVPACLFVFLFSDPSSACLVMADVKNEALVDVGLSSIRAPLRVTTYDRDETEDRCVAYMELELADLPSRSLVPRPRELAESLAPVAEVFGASSCEIAVWVTDLDPAADPPDEDACQSGTFRFSGGSWSTVEDDRPCW